LNSSGGTPELNNLHSEEESCKMAGKPVEVELEAIYKSQIRQVQRMTGDLNRLENETDESSDINANLDYDTDSRNCSLSL
jgi:hypothetical protein